MGGQKIEWNTSKDFPELRDAENGLSVDVLIYSKTNDEHTIGWFNYNKMSWNFLCREGQGKFQWRNINPEHDVPQIKTDVKRN